MTVKNHVRWVDGRTVVYNTECRIKTRLGNIIHQDHLFLFFALRDTVAATVAAAVRFGALLCLFRGNLDDAAADSSRVSSSSTSSSVSPSVPVATLVLVLGTFPSSPLSCVKALLSLSPPTKPAISDLLRTRLVRLPRDLRAGESTCGEDGGDIETRTRRDEMSDSQISSNGNENSCRKKGWPDKFSDGEGERIADGVEPLEPAES